MMTYFDLPIVAVLVAAALTNALHPVNLQTFPLLTGALLGNRWSGRRALQGFLVYVTFLFLWWILLGIIASALFTADSYVGFGAAVVVAVAASVTGLLEVAAILWPRRPVMRLSAPAMRNLVKSIHAIRTPVKLLPVSFRLVALQFAITSLLYLVTLGVLNAPYPQFSLTVVVSYSILYVFPLLVMLGLTLRHYKLSTLQQWVSERAKYVRLAAAVLLITLGWLLLLRTNLVLNLG